jgi:uncharacterized protein
VGGAPTETKTIQKINNSAFSYSPDQMEHAALIQKTAAYIKEMFAGEGSGHDWWHIYRVWQNALYLAREERADLAVVQLAALLHDIADWKFQDNQQDAGAQAARHWLEAQGAQESLIQAVCQIIQEISYKGAGVATPMSSTEGRIVQDADRLDAIGALGIARAFAYGGFKGREMHNPEIAPQLHASFEAYKKNTGPTINHFYEKLLLLKDRMNTAAGKRLAEERHRFMESFLDQFQREWNINV